MSDLNEKCLDTFSAWLRSLGDDIEALLAVAEIEAVGADVRKHLVAGINYIFKSLDLIPDGIDDIGYLDDAFVLRVVSSLVQESDLSAAGADKVAAIASLAEQTALIREFLEDPTYVRLVNYTKNLGNSMARGRTVDSILSDPEVWNAFVTEVRAFAKNYECPSFSREERNLIKLRAFFDAKLPK